MRRCLSSLAQKFTWATLLAFGISSLFKDHKMIIDEIVWNEMFSESADESAKGFEEIEKELNSIIEDNDAKRKGK